MSDLDGLVGHIPQPADDLHAVTVTVQREDRGPLWGVLARMLRLEEAGCLTLTVPERFALARLLRQVIP